MHLSSENIHFSTITGATCTVYKVAYDWPNKTKGKQLKQFL